MLKAIGLQIRLNREQISADTPRRNSKVKLKAIQFRSDKKLKQSVGYIKIKQMKRVKHSAKLSEIEIDMRLKEYFSDHQIMQRFIVLAIQTFFWITLHDILIFMF